MRKLGLLLIVVLLALSVFDGASARRSSGGASSAAVRVYTDGQGRQIVLCQGRGNGHRGDWGWLHIKGKHINGVWYDGGRVTTFPEAFGTRSDGQVQSLIGSALMQSPTLDHGRRQYRWRPSGCRYQVLVVVSSDNQIITSYPQR